MNKENERKQSINILDNGLEALVVWRLSVLEVNSITRVQTMDGVICI